MNLKQLEAFRAVLATGSVTGAAQLLNVSQPSVSRFIRELERSTGFQLFVRTGRGIVPTVEARRFRTAVDSMFIGLGRLEEVAATIRGAGEGEVAMGVIPALVFRVMPEAVARAHRERPSLRIQVSVSNTPALIEAVSLQQLDLAVVSAGRLPSWLHVVHEELLQHVCVIPDGHRLLRRRGAVDLATLAADEIVMFDETSRATVGLDRYGPGAGRSSFPLISHSTPAAAAIARASGKLAVVDPYTASIILAQGGMSVRAIRQPVASRVAIVARGVETLSLVARELAAALRSELSSQAGRVVLS